MSKLEIVLSADPNLLKALKAIAALAGGIKTADVTAEDDVLGGEEDATDEPEEDFFADDNPPPAKPVKSVKPVKEEKGPEKITVEMLRELGATLIKDAKKTAKFKALLAKVGAINLGKVPVEKRAAFYSAMQKI